MKCSMNTSISRVLVAILLLISLIDDYSEVFTDGENAFGSVVVAAAAAAAATIDTVVVTTHTSRQTAARIINGDDTPPDRYPYAVSIRKDNGAHTCGGSLIAPDLVLSAAHCQVTEGGGYVLINHWNGTTDNNTDMSERFNILEEVLHPRYDYTTFGHDTIIVKFDGFSALSPVTLGRNPTLLQDGQSLIVMGWGLTSNDTIRRGDDAHIPVLQQAQVEYVPRSRCRQRWGAAITSDMICAQGSKGFDCTGDSGGPLIIPASHPSDDIQVGIVAWGPQECVDYDTPSVYSFIADQLDWIDSVVCRLSSNPPTDFDCTATYSPAPSAPPSAPSISPAPSIPNVLMTMVLSLDDFPHETGFFIENSHGERVVYLPPGELAGKAGETYTHSFYLDADRPHILVVFDSSSDGFCCDHGYGSYALYIGDSKTGRLLLSGDGSFGISVRQKFITSQNTNVNTTEQVIQQGAADFPLVIGFSSNSSKWTLHRVDVMGRPLVANPSLSNGNDSVNILAERGGLYQLTVVSSDLRIQIFGGVGNGTPLVDSQRTGTITFLAEEPEATAGAVEEFDGGFLTLDIFTDSYPEEIGWILFADKQDSPVAVSRSGDNNDTIVVPVTNEQYIIAYGPARAYQESYANFLIQERLSLPLVGTLMRRSFTFVIHDSGRDGLCCSYGEGSFNLYLGLVENGIFLFGDSFERRERLVYSFSLRGPSAETSSSLPSSRWAGTVPTIFSLTFVFLLWMA